MSGKFSQDVEPRLLARARAGDMDAHAELFRRFGDAVFTLACRLVKRRDIAEEILQETFLDVMRRMEGFRNDAPFGYWLRRMAVNRCLMFLRSYWERHSEALDAEPADAYSADADLLRFDLDALFNRLPAVSRAVLWLHDVEGYTHQEIADLLGRTPSFSKSQLARSHARLRALAAASGSSSEEVGTCTPKSVN
ncbi:MAG TPA: sigma-70 family RNA polymerase sigma factor [Gammaproteobacteria bacterium]